MSNLKPLHHGPMLPLAIMAIFALMIPVISVANANRKARAAESMKQYAPMHMDDNYYGMTPVPTPTMEPGSYMY